MTKEHILSEIRRVAEENNGVPLGKQLFYKATGIRESDWSGIIWVRWGDAIREAGYEPNKFNVRYEDDFILEKLSMLVREIGHFPVIAEIKLYKQVSLDFPDEKTFRKFGGVEKLKIKLRDFCLQRDITDI